VSACAGFTAAPFQKLLCVFFQGDDLPMLVFPARALCAGAAAVASSLASQPGDALLSVRVKEQLVAGTLNAPTRDQSSARAGATASKHGQPPQGLFELAAALGPDGLCRGVQARLYQV
jgi:hypothetical protein